MRSLLKRVGCQTCNVKLRQKSRRAGTEAFLPSHVASAGIDRAVLYDKDVRTGAKNKFCTIIMLVQAPIKLSCMIMMSVLALRELSCTMIMLFLYEDASAG